MAIKLPDPGNGIPEQKTGNDEWTNMKIVRDNFADQSNAASRLVGTAMGNVMTVGSFGVGNINVTGWTDFKEVADLYKQGICSGGLSANSGLTNLPPKFKDNSRTSHLSFSSPSYPTGLFIQAGTITSGPNLAFYSEANAVEEGNVNTVWHTGNTSKDSNTNLLLDSEDTIPNNSAASRLVGTASGNVLEVGAFGLGSNPPPKYWNTSGDLTKGGGIWTAGISDNLVKPTFFPANWPASRTSHLSFGIDAYPTGFIAQTGGKLAYYMTSTSTITQNYTYEIYNSGNTIIENGYLKPSSPVLRLSHSDIVKEHEAKQLDINVDNPEKGVYKITGTTGLRKNDGWYFSPPKDEHFNILCMVEIEEEGDTITVKTYAKKFDFEKVAIVPDYENPVDIIGEVLLRFNDLPQEQLDEPAI